MKHHPSVALLAVLFAGTVTAQEIEVRQLAPARFELTLRRSTAVAEPVAQALLWPRAVQVCGSADPHFGQYHFDSRVPLERNDADSDERSSFEFVQEISCGGETNAATVSQGDLGVLRSSSDRDLEVFVKKISLEQLTARSEGRFEEAYAALSDYLRVLSLDDWSSRARKFNEDAGTLRSAVVWRITVYDNPPGAPRPGVYIAADFEAEYEHLPLQCGYFVWFQLPEERFVITRNETGAIPAEFFEPSRADQLPRIKEQFGCAP